MDRVDRRTFLRTGLAGAGALAVAACTKSSKASGSRGATNLDRPAPRPTIRLSGATDFGVPSPFDYFAAPGYALMIYIYDTLLQEDYNGTMIPLLARTYTPSSDGLTHTFELRDNVKWHDGQPLTADDVVFTYDYFRSQTLAPTVLVKPFDVAGARAIDARTVEIRLDKPAVTFGRQVAGQLPVVPKHVWSTIRDARTAQSLDVLVGSGPYRLESHVFGEGTYLYSANDSYHLGRPFVKRLEFRPVSDDIAGLLAGEIDFGSTAVFGATNDVLATFRGDNSLTIQRRPTAITIPLKWNVGAGGALGDPRFRRACAQAINRNDILQRVTNGNGAAGNPGYLVPTNDYYVPVEEYPFDPVAANRILDAAGYTRSGSGSRQGLDGKPLQLTLTVINDLPAVLELVLAGLKNVGVDLVPKKVPLPAVIGLGNYDMQVGFDGGFGKGTEPDQLRLVYSSTSTAFQHPLGYRNPQVDDLAEREAVTREPAQRKALLADLQRIAAQDLPVLPLYYPDNFNIYRSSVFDQWSDNPTSSLTEAKRNMMTGRKSGISIRPGT